MPQLRGLGRSPTSELYGLRDLAEAVAYLGHPVLGERLRACVAALLALPADSPSAVLGSTDALKLRSSLTLFAAAAREAGREDDAALFERALARFYGGEPCPLTLARIRAGGLVRPRP
ncbi:MAG: DUF1810 family protein [Xanthomonadales bacterium]|nr:DUF1810 family protein [Xanthomonadales bacterium]